jgi:hypothetical protein
MDSGQVVLRFGYEFKNNANHGTVDELMSEDFVHHLPYHGMPPATRRDAGHVRIPHRRDPRDSRADPARH